MCQGQKGLVLPSELTIRRREAGTHRHSVRAGPSRGGQVRGAWGGDPGPLRGPTMLCKDSNAPAGTVH